MATLKGFRKEGGKFVIDWDEFNPDFITNLLCNKIVITSLEKCSFIVLAVYLQERGNILPSKTQKLDIDLGHNTIVSLTDLGFIEIKEKFETFLNNFVSGIIKTSDDTGIHLTSLLGAIKND